MFTLFAAMLSPLLDILGVDNPTIALGEATSVGKSTALRVAASVAGNPSKVIGEWDATLNAVQGRAEDLGELPFILDDTKRARSEFIIRDTLYSHARGVGRARMSKDRELVPTRKWRAVLLTSGEGNIKAYAKDGGAHARVITLMGMPFKDANKRALVDGLNRAVSEHHGHALRLLVRYIVDNPNKRKEWKADYERLADEYAEQADNIGGRLARPFAGVVMAGVLMHRAFKAAGYALPWPELVRFEELWAGTLSETAEAPVAVRALTDMYDWTGMHMQGFYCIPDGRSINDRPLQQPYDGWHGRWDYPNKDWTYIAFSTTRLQAKLKEWGYNYDEVVAGWKGKAWLELDSAGKTTRNVRMGKDTTARLLVVKRAAFDSLSTGD